MNTERLDAFLRADFVGSLEWNRTTQRGTFTYDDGYRSGADPTPLSLSMPITAARHRGKVIAAYLWGLLPDNDAVLERWARLFQVSLSNPMGLLASVGADLPGAVSIVEPGVGLDPAADDVEWLTDAEVGIVLRALSALEIELTAGPAHTGGAAALDALLDGLDTDRP